MDEKQQERKPARLPVFWVLSESIGVITKQPARVSIASVIPFLIALGFQISYALNIDSNDIRSWAYIVSAFLMAVAAVTVHRVVLLGNESVGKFGVTLAHKARRWMWVATIIPHRGNAQQPCDPVRR